MVELPKMPQDIVFVVAEVAPGAKREASATLLMAFLSRSPSAGTVKLVQDIVLETKLMSPRRNLEKVVADLDLGGTGTSAPGMEGVAEEDDDLLDLMDGA